MVIISNHEARPGEVYPFLQSVEFGEVTVKMRGLGVTCNSSTWEAGIKLEDILGYTVTSRSA